MWYSRSSLKQGCPWDELTLYSVWPKDAFSASAVNWRRGHLRRLVAWRSPCPLCGWGCFYNSTFVLEETPMPVSARNHTTRWCRQRIFQQDESRCLWEARIHTLHCRRSRGRQWTLMEPIPGAAAAAGQWRCRYLRMKHRLRTSAGKAVSGLRKTTSDPVFGIIKAVMGFRSFQRRGFAKAQGGWSLACIAWHIKMLHAMTR